MFCAKEYGKEPLVAVVHGALQHLLQRQPGVHRRSGGTGERQPRQLYGDASAICGKQQENARHRQGQLRACHREIGEGNKAAQHKAPSGVDQEQEEDGKGYRVAQSQGVQPIPLACVAAVGQVAVYVGTV